MSSRRTTNAELNASAQGVRRQSDTIMTQILQEHTAQQKATRGRPRTRPDGLPTGGGLDPGMLLDLDLGVEVGKMTPPLTIYRPDPVTGELVKVETISATVFRNRVLQSKAGKHFQRRIVELQKKRQKAGQRAKDRARMARSRYATMGRRMIAPCTVDEPEAVEAGEHSAG